MRLTERLLSCRRDESGAVAIIVVALVGTGVLLGTAALTVDLGNIYAQRGSVQNAADAAAYALAEDCVRTGRCLASSATGLSVLAGQNGKATLNEANNQPSYAQGICGRNLPSTATTDLPQCQPPTGAFLDCPAMPDAMADVAYVEAHTQTLVNNQHLLPPIVAQALGFPGANVQACARAAFGPATPNAQNTLPLTMSYCDWQSSTGYVDPAHPGTFQNPPLGDTPGYDTANRPWPTTEVSVMTAKDNTTTCPTWNGHVAPGGFSWLDRTGGGCSANVIAGWVGGTPGNNYECDLSPYWKKMVFIPLYDCVSAVVVDPIVPSTGPNPTNCTSSANGSNIFYHVAGYAAFYLSGWHFSSSIQNSIRPPNSGPCPGSDRCLSGWFTQALMSNVPPAPSTSTTPDFGPKVVKPAG